MRDSYPGGFGVLTTRAIEWVIIKWGIPLTPLYQLLDGTRRDEAKPLPDCHSQQAISGQIQRLFIHSDLWELPI